MLNLFRDLEKAVKSEDLLQTNEIIEKIKNEKDSFEYIEPMLRLIEENSNLDFGDPGPMVHFMESYYHRGYEQFLIQSIERKPTVHTIWMLNRILNDPNLLNRQMYIEMLNELMTRTDLDKSVAEEIQTFLSYQDKK